MSFETLKDARVLVTGGAGFIGSEVCAQLLEHGADVTVLDDFSSGRSAYLDQSKITVVRGDICDETLTRLSLADQEIVIHLAALPFIPNCYIAPDSFFRVNALATVSLIWRAIQTESVKRFVVISTSEVYGTARFVPMTEDHPTLPHSTYAASKLAADRGAFTIHKEQGFPIVIIRPFNSYGPRVTQPYIIPEIILQLRKGPELTLGNTSSSRDFTYVRDTAGAIILASIKQPAIGQTINVGSGNDITIEQLAKLIGELRGQTVRIKTDERRNRPYDVERLVASNAKAKEILGWTPTVSMREGLNHTINWINQHAPEDGTVPLKDPFQGWVTLWNDLMRRRRNGGR
jgi:nucleoside-diphosphate-sugar epimerase